MGKKIVIALGGNALGSNSKEQLELVKNTASSIVKLVKDGNDVIVAHGNGPQVGMINLAMEYSSNNGGNTPAMPFPECGAMSQGYIGYHLQQSIQKELKDNGLNKPCATIVTQVIVDENDDAFKNPTKPIGSFYSEEEAKKIMEETGYTFVEDAGRGYRRVVASPKPVDIVELDVVEQLVDNGTVVITVGGGGIPVIKKGNGLEGVPAVIDKDRSSAKLASLLKADVLLILTAVEKVSINFNKPDQLDLSELTLNEANKYIAEGQFAKGSMLPKVEACMDFINGNPEGTAIITSLDKALDAIHGDTGTIIKK
ncbi:MAG: carbamate kinase [Tenericutes bacterium]|nr:carbamate kinase [Mycoplasmatota bacterium]